MLTQYLRRFIVSQLYEPEKSIRTIRPYEPYLILEIIIVQLGAGIGLFPGSEERQVRDGLSMNRTGSVVYRVMTHF